MEMLTLVSYLSFWLSQQMRGSGSPTSISSTRMPRMSVRVKTMETGSAVLISQEAKLPERGYVEVHGRYESKEEWRSLLRHSSLLSRCVT